MALVNHRKFFAFARTWQTWSEHGIEMCPSWTVFNLASSILFGLTVLLTSLNIAEPLTLTKIKPLIFLIVLLVSRFRVPD